MRKILSLILGLLFSISANAGCNLWNLNEITHKDVTNYVVNETGFSGTGNTAVNAFVSTNQTFPAGTYTFSFAVTPTTSTFFIFGASDLSKIYINGINNFTDNSGITAYFHTAHGSYTNTGTKVKIKSSVPFKIGFALAGITYTYSDIKLERGDTATEYTPYNPLCETCDGTIVNYVSATGTGVQNGTPTPDNPIEPIFYQQGNMILRAVGDVADSYDATTGKITRRIGVKVLDGTEDWDNSATKTIAGYRVLRSIYFFPSDLSSAQPWFVSHFKTANSSDYEVANQATRYNGTTRQILFSISENIIGVTPTSTQTDAVNAFNQYLADQYANGTPVTIYYPLATEVEEDWPASYCERSIKIATTKYNESAFRPLNTALQNAISVVDTVVSNTITQAGHIATLQTQKQTRPNDIADDNEKCPAGKKCLLVEDASGIPHWYEIVEKYSRLPDGYTELEYIESTGTQYIDTGIKANLNTKAILDFQLSGYNKKGFILGSRTGTNTDAFIIGSNSGDFANTTHPFGQFDNATPTDVKTLPNFDLNRHIFELSSDGFYMDRTLYTTYSAPTSFSTPENIVLFARYSAGSLAYGAFKAYSLKLYNNNTLVRDFVPAKNPDGKIGMYDLANGVFYENAGTGEFIGGQPVFN